MVIVLGTSLKDSSFPEKYLSDVPTPRPPGRGVGIGKQLVHAQLVRAPVAGRGIGDRPACLPQLLDRIVDHVPGVYLRQALRHEAPPIQDSLSDEIVAQRRCHCNSPLLRWDSWLCADGHDALYEADALQPTTSYQEHRHHSCIDADPD